MTKFCRQITEIGIRSNLRECEMFNDVIVNSSFNVTPTCWSFDSNVTFYIDVVQNVQSSIPYAKPVGIRELPKSSLICNICSIHENKTNQVLNVN